MDALKKSRIGTIMFIVILAGTLACQALSPEPTATPTAVPTSTPRPTAIPSPTAPPTKPPLSERNFESFSPLLTWDTESTIVGVAMSTDGKKVALLTQHGDDSTWLELRDAENGERLWRTDIRAKATYNAVAFSPDGDRIATGTMDGNVRIWNGENGELVTTISHHKWPIRAVMFSPNGEYIAAGGSDSSARVWKVSNGMEMGRYDLVTNARDIAFSPDSRRLAVTANYVQVYVVEARSDDFTTYYDERGRTKNLGEVAFSPDGTLLIGAGRWHNTKINKWRYAVLIWDFPHNRTDPTTIELDDVIEDAVITPDGKLMVAVFSGRGILLLIDIWNREVVTQIDIGPKLYMSYSADTTTFVVVSTKTTVTIWGVGK